MALAIAYIHKAVPEGEDAPVYGLSFPDFPGIAVGGRNEDELRARGRDALESHIAVMIAEGLPLPRPGVIVEGPEDRTGFVGVTYVEFDLPTKTQRVAITLEEDLLTRIDRAAAAIGETRSGFLARAARERMQREPA